MGCYQYYEFLALDGPICDEGLQYAQSCSSRAEVSRYRWVNSYHWGDFSGSVDHLLKYYDAFYYFADWGSVRFSLSFPEGSFPMDSIEPYLMGGDVEYGAGLECSGGPERYVLTWAYHEEAGYWDDWEDASGLLGRLSALREQILLGDYRALFLAWLARFDPEWVDDEAALVPPIPPGMNRLTDALSCLAGLLQVEEGTIQAVAELSSGSCMPDLVPIPDVIDMLSVDEMKHLLIRVVEGAEGRVRAELTQKMRPQVVSSGIDRITQGAFAMRVLKIREERTRKRERKAEEKRCEEERIRRAHLELAFKQSEEIWKRLDQWLVKKTPTAYDTAFEQLKELRDAFAHAGKEDEFAERLSQFRMKYGRRPALMRRLEEL